MRGARTQATSSGRWIPAAVRRTARFSGADGDDRSLQRRCSQLSVSGLDSPGCNRGAFIPSLERLLHYRIFAPGPRSNGTERIVGGRCDGDILLAARSANCPGVSRFRGDCFSFGPWRNSPQLAVGFYRHSELVDRLEERLAADDFTSVVNLCAGTVLSRLAAADLVAAATMDAANNHFSRGLRHFVSNRLCGVFRANDCAVGPAIR